MHETPVQLHHSRRVLFAGAIALTLLVGLSLLLSSHHVLAQLHAPQASWTVEKSVNATAALQGDRLTYTVHVQNGQVNPVNNLRLTDTLVNELDLVTNSLTATQGHFGYANGVITWAFNLDDQAWLTFSADILTATSIVNTAYVTGNGELVSDSVTTVVAAPSPSLAVLKTYAPRFVGSGETMTYTVHISNIGTAPADRVWMTDDLPSEVAFVTGSLTASQGLFGVAGDVITWHVTANPSGTLWLPAQTRATLTFTVRLLPDNRDQYTFTNTARITSMGALLLASAKTTVINTATVWLPAVTSNYPPIPILSPIPEPDANNSYTVSWSSVGNVDNYVLQESTSADFGTITNRWQLTETSQLVQNTIAHGTRYYRVRADNANRWGEGSWSNVQSVQLFTNYFDSFDDPNSGWFTHSAKCCLTPGVCDGVSGERINLDYKYSLYYQDGRYHTYIPTNCLEGGDHGWTRHIYPISFAPDIVRPTARTCIGMRGSFEKYNWVSKWGIVFAASDDMSTNYVFWVDDRGDFGITRRTGYQFPGPNHSYVGTEERKWILEPANGHRPPAKPYDAPNSLKVEFNSKSILFYLNGELVYTLNEAWWVNEINTLQNVGIFGGNWEWGDTQIGYDYFFVDEGCDNW